MTTSWSCTGDPATTAAEDELELSYECSVGFNLFYYRHIRQVKIGEQVCAIYCLLFVRKVAGENPLLPAQTQAGTQSTVVHTVVHRVKTSQGAGLPRFLTPFPTYDG